MMNDNDVRPRHTHEASDVAALPFPYRSYFDQIARYIPEHRIILDPLRLFAYGTDASFYRLTPKLAIKARSLEEVTRLVRLAASLKLPVTFRAGGTSLSGQAVTDSILIMLSGGWKRAEIYDAGDRISLEPGVIGAEANQLLARYGKKIGPDPASINSCMIGGIAANNASGMCCGTAQNSYQTIHAMKLIFADGSFFDTANKDSRKAFANSHKALLDGISAIRAEILADGALTSLIREKYRIKNTTGYGLNSFVDFEDPIDILLHLMIGSEGTLAFIGEVTYNTVPEHPHKASALVFFSDIAAACRATIALKKEPVSAVELMDRASLRSVEDKAGMPPILKSLGSEAAALLIEVRADSEERLAEYARYVEAALKKFPTLETPAFTAVRAEVERLWNVRRGLFPAVGGNREIGTTVVIEDVSFPLETMADGAVDLQLLMKKHGYEGIIFGHALDGNFHFVFTQNFGTSEEVERYGRFIEEVCDLIVTKYHGALKGEHGTGRNMAPFVEREWGKKAFLLMKRLKLLFDPDGILNPGVIINGNPRAHLECLKPLPKAHSIIDKCIECGFCEVKCPSRELTLTPRQRISVQREIFRLDSTGSDPELLARLRRDYKYLGEETCATDGLCATACPVGIDTGAYTKIMRAEARNAVSRALSRQAASQFSAVLQLARAGLKAAEALPAKHWRSKIPRAPLLPSFEDILHGKTSAGAVVYFTSCISRTLGPSARELDQRAITEAMLSVLKKARFDVLFPDRIEELCCGLPFESKGFPQSGETKLKELENALLHKSDNGRIPILCDTSPCTLRMLSKMDSRLRVYESVDFIHTHLMKKLDFTPIPGPLMLHVTCSSTKMGLGDKFKAVAQACCEKVITPRQVGCCGFAGDRGFSHPELNSSALSSLKAEVPADCTMGVSNSRTCEIGLTAHSGVSYQSIVYLVDRCTRPRDQSPV